MRRIFGSSKPQDKPTLDGAISLVDKQGDHMEQRISKINLELQTLNTQMKNATSQTAKNVLKTKALRLLKQRKQYENQLNQIRQQSFNLDNMNYAVQSMQNAVTISGAIQAGTKAIKKLMEEANEINNLLGDAYGQEVYDEDELMAEFQDIEIMCADEENTGRILDDIGITNELNNINVPKNENEINNQSIRQPVLAASNNTKTTNQGIKVDEFGLPID